ncbi:unnamed protein product [Ilex paraguariensis]|uniref:Uncharacterized protein n=1 Tax=Ilex paraguariensis TaxID=185542 RepID=A0ABC8SPZ9_9AQUA
MFMDSKFSLVSGIKSGATDAFSLPPLFASVRSNARNGAALAAAAAVSRLVLTPHAATIKSRRASSATFNKVLDSCEELDSKASGGGSEVVSEGRADFEGLGGPNNDADQVGSEMRQSYEKFVEEDNVELDNFQSAAVEVIPKVDASGALSTGGGDRIGEFCLSESDDGQVSNVDNLERVASSSPYVEHYVTSPVSSVNDLNLDDVKDEKVPSSSADEKNDDNAELITLAISEKQSSSSHVSDEGANVVEDSTIVISKTHDSEHVVPQSKYGGVSLAGDYTSSPSNAMEIFDLQPES